MMDKYTTEEKIKYYKNKISQKATKHQNKYPAFDSDKLYNWIINRIKDKSLNKQLWGLKYYYSLNISEISKKIRSENSLTKWVSKDNF